MRYLRLDRRLVSELASDGLRISINVTFWTPYDGLSWRLCETLVSDHNPKACSNFLRLMDRLHEHNLLH